MCRSRFTIKKFLKLLGEIWFYSATILIFFIIINPDYKIGILCILQNLFPITYNSYWFVTSYMMLMILTPYLNKLITVLEKKALQKLLIILYILWSIIPCLLKGNWDFNSLGWFITLYLTSSYIRNYIKINDISIKNIKLITILSILLLFLSVISFNYLGYNYNIESFLNESTYFESQNSILIVIISINTFIISLSKNFTNKFINKLASTTFGIYLIHDNNFIRPFLWKTILNCDNMYNSKYLLILALTSISLVYIVCTIIDLLRQLTIEKLYLKLINLIVLHINFHNIMYKTKKLVFTIINKTIFITQLKQ